VTVALCGQGSDELYGGYRKHRAASALGPFRVVPRTVRRSLARLLENGDSTFARAVRTVGADGPADRLLAMSGLLSSGERSRLLHGPLAGMTHADVRRYVSTFANGVPDDPLPASLYVDAQLALVDDMLHFTDRASMAHSLEVRVPFLDYRVVEHAAKIPAAQKIKRMETKLVLKQAARGVIPDQIIDKRKIGFFGGTVSAWLARQLEGLMTAYLLDPGARYGDYLERVEVERLIRRHRSNATRHEGLLLFAILMLEIWLKTYLPRALAQSATPVASQR
jgi:asparagine synthase (glutamine-hydrolysing)